MAAANQFFPPHHKDCQLSTNRRASWLITGGKAAGKMPDRFSDPPLSLQCWQLEKPQHPLAINRANSIGK